MMGATAAPVAHVLVVLLLAAASPPRDAAAQAMGCPGDIELFRRCGGARRVSIGNCLICLVSNFGQPNHGGCSADTMDAFCSSGAGPGPAPQQSHVAVLRDPSIPEPFDVDLLVASLAQQPNLKVATIGSAALSNGSALNPKIFSVLVVPNAPSLPRSGLSNYLAFAMDGGSLVLLGGKPTTVPLTWGDPETHINVFEDYSPLRMMEVTAVDSVVPTPVAIGGDFRANGTFVGLSAIGYAVPGKSRVTPVLAARKSFGRVCGWAAALVENFGGWGTQCQPQLAAPAPGCFVGSWFLIFGIKTASFYDSPAHGHRPSFVQFVANAISRLMLDGQPRPPPPPRSPPPALPPDRVKLQPIAISARNRRALVVSGTEEPFHIMGVNYEQASWANPQVENVLSQELILADVEKVAELGVNTVRLACCWGPFGFLPNSSALTDIAMDALALRNIRILYTLPPCTSQKQCIQRAAQTLRALRPRYRDTVFAVDIRNEVTVPDLATYVCANGSTLGAAAGGWDAAEWEKFRAWANTTTDFDNYRFVQHRLDQGLPSEFEAIWHAVNAMYTEFLTWLVPIVRQELPTSLVCCGTFDELELLPAAGALDFACHHSYPTISGTAGQCDCENGGGCLVSSCGRLSGVNVSEIAAVPNSLAVIDRIMTEYGAVRPLIHAETGISNGLHVDADTYLDVHASSVWDTMLYLSPIAKGFAGTLRWTINDFEPYATTSSNITPPQIS